MSKNGLILLTPTSIAYTGTSATISANGSVSFSAVSSLSLNGVFSADYDNYMIVSDNTNSDTTTSHIFTYHLRSSGTDASTANYTYQRLDANGTTVSGARSASQTYGWYGAAGYGAYLGNIFHLYGPHLAQPTASRNISTAMSSLGVLIVDVATTHSLSTSYDGITFSIVSGNVTGRVAVYGMRK
jgi:hypothetical protein